MTRFQSYRKKCKNGIKGSNSGQDEARSSRRRMSIGMELCCLHPASDFQRSGSKPANAANPEWAICFAPANDMCLELPVVFLPDVSLVQRMDPARIRLWDAVCLPCPAVFKPFPYPRLASGWRWFAYFCVSQKIWRWHDDAFHFPQSAIFSLRWRAGTFKHIRVCVFLVSEVERKKKA